MYRGRLGRGRTIDGDLDGRPQVDDLSTPNKALGIVRGDGTNEVLGQMGSDLKDIKDRR